MKNNIEIYKRAKFDILQSKNIEQLKVSKFYMDLAKDLLTFEQWNDLFKNYELKNRLLTENIN